MLVQFDEMKSTRRGICNALWAMLRSIHRAHVCRTAWAENKEAPTGHTYATLCGQINKEENPWLEENIH